MNDYRGPSPTDLPAELPRPGAPALARHADGNGAARPNGAAPNGSGPPPPSAGRHATVDFEAVGTLRSRVSTRLSAGDGISFEALDSAAQRERTRTVAMEELQNWTAHRQHLGQSVLSLADEDALIDAVLAGVGGLGRLEPLLLREDVEDIFFNGTAPTMLRLADGRKVAGDSLASSNEELRYLLQHLGSQLGDGSSREFSDARPLLALRLKAVGTLGGRLSAAMDVTPNPVGTIRIHRHPEADLDALYEDPRVRMIDAPLRAFLRASVLAGLKVAVVGAMGHGKTFLLRSLCAEIPLEKAIITVEDERELGLHVLPARDARGQVIRREDGTVVPRRAEALVKPYEARPANSEGSGAVTVADLLYHALRDSADVLILGESRAGEIVHFLDAATNGTAGVMGTWHANSADEVFDRIVQMVLKAHPPLPTEWALRASSALDLVVFVRRNQRHERFVSEVLEVHSGPLGERGVPDVTHLFAPRHDGRAVPTGHRPSDHVLAKLDEVGFSVGWLQPHQSDWDRFGEGEPR